MKRVFISGIKSGINSSLKRLWGSSRRSRTQGFTLLELLIVTAIGAGIVSGLMFIVVQLMETDQREASRSETQREMQMAMDYISAELREAVFVYTGSQLQTMVAGNYLPTSVTNSNSVPVLAFWKQQEFPTVAKNFCRANRGDSTANVAARAGINCEAGSSYALVVYSVRPLAAGDIWRGRARLTRYALTEFRSSTPLAINQGYVNPGTFGNFPTWPVGTSPSGAANVNLQGESLATIYSGRNPQGRPTGRPNGDADVLVDFVAHPAEDATTNPSCPTGYDISPANVASIAATVSRSFYACVPPRINTGDNQEVLLFLQGSVQGRAGYTTGLGARTADKLPALETRVLTRGVLGRTPATN